MTSSLVGSEMCIRDSYRSSTCLPGCPGSPRHSSTLLASPHAVYTPGTPVSYTHLTLPTICSV
eukprot:4156048-Prorocentrum_lima.AAC.1